MLDRLAFLKLFPAGALLLQTPNWQAKSSLHNHIPLKETLIYENPLASTEDLKNFHLEGEAALSFENGKLRMQNKLDPALGQKSNFVLWCPKKFPADIVIRWKFRPLSEPGLAMMFFAANGKDGQDLFDKRLAIRKGEYNQYHHGDMNAFHLAYFRRRYDTERAFHLCNLRKSYGANIVAQGADPIPSVSDILYPMEMKIVKSKATITFYINDLLVLTYADDGQKFGSLLKGGYLGFRQMAPLIAEYWDLKIHSLSL
ncbi:DUF1961 family protein [Pedobacter arcticus]|uniref:DUF1961 family protein n=1 Tax=Pedobacter arcticus TaxID=752140 RepID=UPI0002F09DF3|nr:DUF1961 family protein [Pedobacter arcticus]